MKTSTKLRPAVKRHGGKAYLARRILSLLPPHEVYVEPFAGGLSVLLNKARARTEVASDLDAGLMQFYTTLRDQPETLTTRLVNVPYTAEAFDSAWYEDGLDPVDAAIRFLVRNRFSRGGLGKNFAWSDRMRGGQPGDKNGWETIQKQLPLIAERLQGVDLMYESAFDIVAWCATPNTLFYLDPPYLPETRTARQVYQHEMSTEDHEKLLKLITNIEAKVVISGYHNPLYDHALADWTCREFDMPNHAGQGKTKQRRTEVLWLSPTCDRFELEA